MWVSALEAEYSGEKGEEKSSEASCHHQQYETANNCGKKGGEF